MKNPLSPFPKTEDDLTAEKVETINKATSEYLDAVAEAHVPDRLRDLAVELGQALEAQRLAGSDGPSTEPRADDDRKLSE